MERETNMTRWTSKKSRRAVALIMALLLLMMALMTGCTSGSGTNGGNGSETSSGTNGGSDTDIEDPGVPAMELPEIVLSNMTLEQKISEMMMLAFRSQGDPEEPDNVTEISDKLVSIIKKYPLGGIILFEENMEGAAQTAKLIRDMQDANHEAGYEYGLLIGVDQEGGMVTRVPTGTQTPGSMAIGATGDPGFANEVGWIIGGELKALGFNVNFGPVLDVNNNPANPIIGVRAFSDDPTMVAEYGAKYMEGIHEQNIISAIKHFPGHGDTDTDSHTGLPLIDRSLDELMELELAPFRALAEDTDMVMTAHIQYPQIEKGTYKSKKSGNDVTLPATLSKTIITDVLRNEIGFSGVVITDALDMGAISEHFDRIDAARLAINAGVDMLLMPVSMHVEDAEADLDEYIKEIAKLVESGEIPEERINEAVERILNLKTEYSVVYENIATVDESAAAAAVGSEENHDVEWEIARHGVTLVKDSGNGEGPLVPEGSKVTIAIPYRSEMNSPTLAAKKLLDDGIIDADQKIEAINYGDILDWDVNDLVDNADVVIGISAVYGQSEIDPKTEDGAYTAFLLKLMKATKDKGKKFILISAQLPYDIAAFQDADAILACYGARGMAVVPDGDYDELPQYGPNIPAAIYAAFSGEYLGVLPVNIPKLNEDYTYSNELFYERGFGIKNQ